jgi:hypothetical protein
LPLQGLTQREFAEKDGCAHTTVQNGVRRGSVTTFSDGSIDPALAGTPWRPGNRRNLKGGKVPARKAKLAAESATPQNLPAPGETPAQAAERIIRTVGATMTQLEAERVKENYTALLKQLDYDVKSGRVILSERVAIRVAAEFANVRTKLLAIPSERAPALHRLKTVEEVRDLLDSAIGEALDEMTLDQTPHG